MDRHSPKVSVVIPAYNAEATLEGTLQSVLGQTFSDIEVLVVDDGSQDRTSEIARCFGNPVRVIFQENRGVSEARNNGVKGARGLYIALLDADDVWHPDKLEKQVRMLDANQDVMGNYVGVVRVSASGDTLEHLPARGFDDLCRSLLLHSSVIPTSPSSLVLRREAFDLVGLFDPRFSQCADWDFLIRASLKVTLAPVEGWLVRYRTAMGNMSSDISLLERDTFAVLDKFYASEDARPYQDIKDRVYSNHWLILSGSYLHDGQPGRAAGCLVQALRRDPTNIGYPLALPMRFLRRSWGSRTRRSSQGHSS